MAVPQVGAVVAWTPTACSSSDGNRRGQDRTLMRVFASTVVEPCRSTSLSEIGPRFDALSWHLPQGLKAFVSVYRQGCHSCKSI
mmetsp:Transcript_16291/g.44878  ORF Transcript_16291/g.44878 Transcript_16291/m.44878 type:complete len:84 (+) Transcript_16291:976-1227(+)